MHIFYITYSKILKMPLTVHHLRRSQSERIVWLCEELIAINPNFQYELIKHERDPVTALAPPSLKDLSPARTAPVLMDDNVNPPVVLAESQAIVEYIVNVYGGGNLVAGPTSPEYVQYLSWYNFANGSLQPGLTRLGTVDLVVKAMTRISAKQEGEDMSTAERANQAQKDGQNVTDPLTSMIKARLDNHLDMLNKRLSETRYLAGEYLTAADIMIVFSLTTMRGFYPYSLKEYPNILTYLGLIAKRPAYMTAFGKAEPGLEPLITPEVEPFDFEAFR